MDSLRIVILGLSITSSWGNGHATTYRGLVREMAKRGHRILFLERDVPWYAANRDMLVNPGAEVKLYQSLDELQELYESEVRHADAVILGSYVPEGIAIGEWALRTADGATAFYDIDTPVTLQLLADGQCEYLSPELIPQFSILLSFSGGPVLRYLEQEYGAQKALPLYCSVDPAQYYYSDAPCRWDLGYMGTYSDDRQPALQSLLIETALRHSSGRFAVAGPQYPADIKWPENVERIEHIPPADHRSFYSSQRFTLNVTRSAMVKAGHSPSVRLFEAAACGVPVISDWWEGLSSFFVPGQEILIAENTEDCLRYINGITEEDRRMIGERARRVVLTLHTSAKRAEELESYLVATGAGRMKEQLRRP